MTATTDDAIYTLLRYEQGRQSHPWSKRNKTILIQSDSEMLSQMTEERTESTSWMLEPPFKRPEDYRVLEFMARDQRYVLFNNGDFFDLENDIDQESPLKIGELSRKEKKIHKRLQKELESSGSLMTNNTL